MKYLMCLIFIITLVYNTTSSAGVLFSLKQSPMDANTKVGIGAGAGSVGFAFGMGLKVWVASCATGFLCPIGIASFFALDEESEINNTYQLDLKMIEDRVNESLELGEINITELNEIKMDICKSLDPCKQFKPNFREALFELVGIDINRQDNLDKRIGTVEKEMVKIQKEFYLNRITVDFFSELIGLR